VGADVVQDQAADGRVRLRRQLHADEAAHGGAEPVDLHGADAGEETLRITAAINRLLEGLIREHPEQWNWIHPRWKTRPSPESEAPIRDLDPHRMGV
jgi:hypothetical protein